MSANKPEAAGRGWAGRILLGAGVLLALGLILDFLTAQASFWAGAAPGVRAAIGLAAALFAILAGHVARVALTRKIEDEKTDDVVDHA